MKNRDTLKQVIKESIKEAFAPDNLISLDDYVFPPRSAAKWFHASNCDDLDGYLLRNISMGKLLSEDCCLDIFVDDSESSEYLYSGESFWHIYYFFHLENLNGKLYYQSKHDFYNPNKLVVIDNPTAADLKAILLSISRQRKEEMKSSDSNLSIACRIAYKEKEDI